MSTVLGFSLPMLTVLAQCVAESEGDWNFLNVKSPTGAWVGVARFGCEDRLTISANHGEAATEPYPAEIHERLLSHGFEHVPEHSSYSKVATFDTDAAFLDVARLVAGTFLHAWSANLADHLAFDLHLSSVESDLPNALATKRSFEQGTFRLAVDEGGVS